MTACNPAMLQSESSERLERKASSPDTEMSSAFPCLIDLTRRSKS